MRIPKASQFAHEVAMLASHLRSVDDEEHVVTYEVLDRIAGFSVRERRHVLDAAKRDSDKDWLTVRGVGIKLYTDEERCREAENYRLKLQRQAKRGERVLSGVASVASLGDQDRVSLNTGMVQVSLVKRVTSSSGTKKLKEAIRVQGSLPSAKALDLFR